MTASPGLVVSPEILNDLARTADLAALEVGRFLDIPWSEPVEILVVQPHGGGAGSARKDRPVARTVAMDATDSPGLVTSPGSSVVVDLDLWSSLPPTGRSVVLTHELVHVLTRSALLGLPRWFEEGLADYVAWRGRGVPMSAAASEAFDSAQVLGVPRRLPGDAALDGDPRRAYEGAVCQGQAYVAVSVIGREYGETAVVDVYKAATDNLATANGVTSLDSALRTVTGSGIDGLTNDWQFALSQ